MPTGIVSTLARTGAGALRTGAALLDRLGEERPQQRSAPQPSGRRTPPKDLDDATLARKVETHLKRGLSGPQKGKVTVNVADGIVYLRGEAKRPEDVKRLTAKAEAIPEVKRVENLLHLPKTPARKPKPRAGGAKPKPRAKRVNAEVPVPGAEPSPNETARTRQGRRAAPLGSN